MRLGLLVRSKATTRSPRSRGMRLSALRQLRRLPQPPHRAATSTAQPHVAAWFTTGSDLKGGANSLIYSAVVDDEQARVLFSPKRVRHVHQRSLGAQPNPLTEN